METSYDGHYHQRRHHHHYHTVPHLLSSSTIINSEEPWLVDEQIGSLIKVFAMPLYYLRLYQMLGGGGEPAFLDEEKIKKIWGQLHRFMHYRSRLLSLKRQPPDSSYCTDCDQGFAIFYHSMALRGSAIVQGMRPFSRRKSPRALFVLCTLLAPQETLDHFSVTQTAQESKWMIKLRVCMEHLYAAGQSNQLIFQDDPNSSTAGDVRGSLIHLFGGMDVFYAKIHCVRLLDNGDHQIVGQALWDRIENNDVAGLKELLRTVELGGPYFEEQVDGMWGGLKHVYDLENEPHPDSAVALSGFVRLLALIKEHLYFLETLPGAMVGGAADLMAALGLGSLGTNGSPLFQRLEEAFIHNFGANQATPPAAWWTLMEPGFRMQLLGESYADALTPQAEVDDAIKQLFSLDDVEDSLYARYKNMYDNPSFIIPADGLFQSQDTIWARLDVCVTELGNFMKRGLSKAEREQALRDAGVAVEERMGRRPRDLRFCIQRDAKKLRYNTRICGPRVCLPPQANRAEKITALVLQGGLSVSKMLSFFHHHVGQLDRPPSTIQSWLNNKLTGVLKVREPTRGGFDDSPFYTPLDLENYLLKLLQKHGVLVQWATQLARANRIGILESADPCSHHVLGPYFTSMMHTLNAIASSAAGGGAAADEDIEALTEELAMTSINSSSRAVQDRPMVSDLGREMLEAKAKDAVDVQL